jgi:anti-sigma-K factor RskA
MIHAEAAQMLAAGAALEDLEADEWREYEAHRRTCAECARLEVELDHVLADLALAVPERMPPPELLVGIRRAIAADAVVERPSADARAARVVAPSNVIPLVRRERRERRADRRPVLAAVGLAAALAVVSVSLGARSVALSDELGSARAQLGRMQEALGHQGAAMAVAVNPSHETAQLHAEPSVPGATAFVVYVPGSEDAWLVAHGLPPTPDGHAYQLWFADTAGVHGLGAFTFDGQGAFVAPFSVDLAASSAAMVTLEPLGGATGDPGPQVVFGEL